MVKLPDSFIHPLTASAIILVAILYFCPLIHGTTLVSNASRTESLQSLFPGRDITGLEGIICENPVKSKKYGGTYRTVISVYRNQCGEASCTARGKAVVYIPQAFVEAFFPGKLYTKAGGSNGVLAENGAVVHVEVRPKADGFLVITCESLGWKKGLAGKIDRVRSLCRLQFRRIMYAWDEAGGLLLALLSGAREYTEREVADSFSRAGLAHILALSGMHLSLFSSLSRVLGRKTFGEKLGRILQLFSVFFFVCFAGISASLFRALLCSLGTTIWSFFKRARPKLLTVLSASFIMHALIFPSHLATVAFMLSYGSLAGILILSSVVRHLYVRFLYPSVASAFSSSTAAQLMTAPVNLSLFGTLCPVGVIASVIVCPFVTLFLYAGLAGILLCLCMPFLSPLIRAIMLFVYGIIRETVLFFARCPAVTF